MCGDGDLPSPSFLLFRVTWAGQRSSEWDGLVTDGENSQVWGVVVPGCLSGEQCIFLHLLHLPIGWRKDRSLRRGRSLLFPRVLVHTCMGEARLSGHNLESGAGHCLIDCGGLSLPL